MLTVLRLGKFKCGTYSRHNQKLREIRFDVEWSLGQSKKVPIRNGRLFKKNSNYRPIRRHATKAHLKLQIIFPQKLFRAEWGGVTIRHPD